MLSVCGGLTLGGEGRQEPEDGSVAEDLFEVAAPAEVVLSGKDVAPGITEENGEDFEGGEIPRHEPEMSATQDTASDAPDKAKESAKEDLPVNPSVATVVPQKEEVKEREQRGGYAADARVEDGQEEELVVGKAHAVVECGAVVVHLEDAFLAVSAVMRPRRPLYVTPPAPHQLSPPSLSTAQLSDCCRALTLSQTLPHSNSKALALSSSSSAVPHCHIRRL